MKIKNTAWITALTVALSAQGAMTMDNPVGTDQKSRKCYTNPDLVMSGLPKINIDDFDKNQMNEILKNYGTFELVGPTMDRLAASAQETLAKTKEILTLPIESLEKVTLNLKDFHGFQNVREGSLASRAKAEAEKRDFMSIPIRNQIAYSYKPYFEVNVSAEESKIPVGLDGQRVNMAAFDNYYAQGMVVLNRLYSEIGKEFILPSPMSNLENDRKSVLTTRRYNKGVEGETGIPEHSDMGLLTLVVSDEPGLEVKHGDQWIPAPCSPKLRFFVNVGDWLIFQTGRKDFTVGIHRVPEVQNERFSMALFMNPPPEEKLISPKGVEVNYQDYLMASPDKKKEYR